MSYTLSIRAVVVVTPGMFRALLTTVWFTSGVMTTALPSQLTAFRKPWNALVLMASMAMESTTMIFSWAALAARR